MVFDTRVSTALLEFVENWKLVESQRNDNYDDVMRVLAPCSFLKTRFLNPLSGWDVPVLSTPKITIPAAATEICMLNPYRFDQAGFLQAFVVRNVRFPDETLLTVIRSMTETAAELPIRLSVLEGDVDVLTELRLNGSWTDAPITWIGDGVIRYKADQKCVHFDDACKALVPGSQDGRRRQPTLRSQVLIQVPEVNHNDLVAMIDSFQKALFLSMRLTAVGGNCVIRLPAMALRSGDEQYNEQVNVVFALFGLLFREVRPFVSSQENHWNPRLSLYLGSRLESFEYERNVELAVVRSLNCQLVSRAECHLIANCDLSDYHDLSKFMDDWNQYLKDLCKYWIIGAFPVLPENLPDFQNVCNCDYCRNIDKVVPRESSVPKNSAMKSVWREVRAIYTKHLLSSDGILWCMGIGEAAILKLLPRSKFVVGFDVDQAVLERAEKKAQEMGFSNFKAVRADLNCERQFKFWWKLWPPNAIDCLWSAQFLSVFCQRVLEYNRTQNDQVLLMGGYLYPTSLNEEKTFKCFGEEVLQYRPLKSDKLWVRIPTYHDEGFVEPLLPAFLLSRPDFFAKRVTSFVPIVGPMNEVAKQYFIFSNDGDPNGNWMRVGGRLPPRPFPRGSKQISADSSVLGCIGMPWSYQGSQQCMMTNTPMEDVDNAEDILWYPSAWVISNSRHVIGNFPITFRCHNAVYDIDIQKQVNFKKLISFKVA